MASQYCSSDSFTCIRDRASCLALTLNMCTALRFDYKDAATSILFRSVVFQL